MYWILHIHNDMESAWIVSKNNLTPTQGIHLMEMLNIMYLNAFLAMLTDSFLL